MSGSLTDTREAEANRLVDALIHACKLAAYFWHTQEQTDAVVAERDAAKDAVVRAILGEPASAWQPIATVPQDGSWVLVLHPDVSVPTVARPLGPESDLFENFWAGECFVPRPESMWRPIAPVDPAEARRQAAMGTK